MVDCTLSVTAGQEYSLHAAPLGWLLMWQVDQQEKIHICGWRGVWEEACCSRSGHLQIGRHNSSPCSELILPFSLRSSWHKGPESQPHLWILSLGATTILELGKVGIASQLPFLNSNWASPPWCNLWIAGLNDAMLTVLGVTHCMFFEKGFFLSAAGMGESETLTGPEVVFSRDGWTCLRPDLRLFMWVEGKQIGFTHFQAKLKIRQPFWISFFNAYHAGNWQNRA